MKPLLVLFATFFIATLTIRFGTGTFDHAFAGRTAMSVMLLFTALGHLKFTEGMGGMLPASFPAKRFTILATGVIEIAAAIGLHIASLRQLTGWLLILFFILILPANIYAAMRHLSYETGERTGPGPRYLWFRIPMQLVLIIWAYISAAAGFQDNMSLIHKSTTCERGERPQIPKSGFSASPDLLLITQSPLVSRHDNDGAV